ncbi:MAG: lysozyme family protein [Eubacterium sp.]
MKILKYFTVLISLLFLLICGILFTAFFAAQNEKDTVPESILSQDVLDHRPMLRQAAAEYGIEDYEDYLLAIIQVESEGLHTDVMQSSESLGLPPNSLTTEESIRQGCQYFARLLNLAEEKGCDLDSVLQAYNYGSGFLDYVAENGNAYSFSLAQSFAEEQAAGEQVVYLNPVALKENGGWRYAYGNMFYVRLINQYLE